MDLLEALRGVESTTVAALADELGVSARTIHRDLAALRERGHPIDADSGPGGGVRLDGARGITAVHLSVSEVVTLWLSARLAQAASDLPWSDAASSALTKMLGSLPRARAQELRALCRRVIVGPPAPQAMTVGAGPPELLRLFEAAFTGARGLTFHYRDRHGVETVRRVEPHGLLVHTPVWYVLARDLEKGAPRMFRMDRVTRPRLVEGVRFRPDVGVIDALLGGRGDHWRPLMGVMASGRAREG